MLSTNIFQRDKRRVELCSSPGRVFYDFSAFGGWKVFSRTKTEAGASIKAVASFLGIDAFGSGLFMHNDCYIVRQFFVREQKIVKSFPLIQVADQLTNHRVRVTKRDSIMLSQQWLSPAAREVAKCLAISRA